MHIRNNDDLIRAVSFLERKYQSERPGMLSQQYSKPLLNVPENDPILKEIRLFLEEETQKTGKKTHYPRQPKVYFAFDKKNQLVAKATSVRKLSAVLRGKGIKRGSGENTLRKRINAGGKTAFGRIEAMSKTEYQKLMGS